MLRISTTTLDEYKKYSENPEYDLIKFLSWIKGDTPPSKYMIFGRGFHAILEEPDKYYDEVNKAYIYEGILFEKHLIEPCLEAVGKDGTPEVKRTKIYNIDGEDVEMVAKVDKLFGNTIKEYKTCWSQFNFDKYLHSCQWWLYLDIFELDILYYHVFELKDGKSGIQLKEIHKPFYFTGFPSLSDDIQSLIKDFVRFIHTHELEVYFKNSHEQSDTKQTQSNKEDIMNIQKISISNILGVENMVMNPKDFTVIEGKNGSGKTSVLEAIKGALKGGHDATLLRNGTEKGEVVLVLDDGVTISKTVTESKTDVQLKDSEGKKIAKPQSYIEKLVDMVSVNPIDFITSSKKARVDSLLSAVPMTITEGQITNAINGASQRFNFSIDGHALEVIANLSKKIYDERTGVNRSIKEKTATITQLSGTISDLTQEQFTDSISALQQQISDMDVKRIALNNELSSDRQNQMDAITMEYNQKKDKVNNWYNETQKAIQEKYELKYNPILSELVAKQEQEKQFIQSEKTRQIIQEFEKDGLKLNTESNELTKSLEGLERLKTELLSNIPISGLEIKDGDIYLENIAYDRLNTAKQIKVALEVAKMKSKDLGIICCDGFEKLDTEAFEEFKSQAIQSQLQFIVTKVSDKELQVINA